MVKLAQQIEVGSTNAHARNLLWPLSIPGFGGVERGVRGAPVQASLRMVAGQAAVADGCHQWEPSRSGVGIEAVSTTRGVDGRKSLLVDLRGGQHGAHD